MRFSLYHKVWFSENNMPFGKKIKSVDLNGLAEFPSKVLTLPIPRSDEVDS